MSGERTGRLAEALSAISAPRLLALADLMELATADGGASVNAVRRSVETLERAGSLSKAAHNLWLNMRARPAPTWAEAVHRIRAGAVVSLQTVLGDAGVTNNYTGRVYAVLPFDGERMPRGDDRLIGDTVAHFRLLPRRVLEAGEAWDRLEGFSPYPRATAEAALVHWIYLANTHRSPVTEPDTQCDLSNLDPDRVARLAEACGVAGRVADWMARAAAREDDDDENGWTAGLG